MKNILQLFILICLLILSSCQKEKNKPTVEKAKEWAIAIHGGAGALKPENYSEEQIQDFKTELDKALAIGENILKNGGSSLDAVEKVVNHLEDCPLFNAGKGSVFTNDGKNELDAAIMSGKDLDAGAVAGVGDIKNPISAARKVMEASPHVMMVGKGASLFASQNGLSLVDSSYFYTEKRFQSLQRALERDKKMGTVGCVAKDSNGNLAAATSTGGMTNKRYGRVGDVPIIGAGTYANNKTCAVSATGHGEYFIRYTVAHDISALMEYKGFSLEKAADEVVQKKLVEVNGEGGIIAVDKNGNVHLSFNSLGMFRAFSSSTGDRGIAIFKDKTD